MKALDKIALALPFVVFLAVYSASVGHGFVADDFGWILDSRVHSLHDLRELFFKSSGFYRPIVGLTFAADYALFGTHPLGYGLTNLTFAGICAVLLFLVARELALPAGAAVLAAALWLLNPHGVNTAVLWVSGRTALLLTMGALAAAVTLLRGYPFLALLPAAFALFAKEEALLLPAILCVWWMASPHEVQRSTRQIALWCVCAAGLVGAYLMLRSHTDAITPSTAPSYYRFAFDPRSLAINIREYADRALTFPAAVTALAWLILRTSTRHDAFSRRILLCGAAWIVGGFALTVFIPVRSSLYVCFPSLGACLIAADPATRLWNFAEPSARRHAALAGIVVTLAMSPVYVLRNRPTVRNALFSSWALARLNAATRDVPDGSTVIVLDDPSRRPNIDTAFNTALPSAFELTTGRRLAFWVEPPPRLAQLAGATPPCATCAAATIDLRAR